MKLYYTETPRAPHLFRIWNQLREQSTLPQVDRWLAQAFRFEKKFGKKDRLWYADAIFAALRAGPLLVHAAKAEGLGDSWAALRALPTDQLFHLLSLDHANDPRLELFKQDLLLAAGLPAFYAPYLQQRQQRSQWSADEQATFLRLQKEKAPLWLRLNHPKRADEARNELRAQGIDWQEDGDAWRVDSTKNLQTLACIERGILEIQDRASQDIGAALDASGRKIIWDCCAGGGGKTLQIASRWREAKVIASDVRSYKLEEVKRRADRAGLSNVSTRPWDGGAVGSWPGGVDIILIDAPCSGTGTWRRSPDNKYRLNPAEIQRLQELQLSIIDRVLPVLKSGGQLIYATCSWLVDENEAVIEHALRRHPELRLENQKLSGNPSADADTMFHASLRKA